MKKNNKLFCFIASSILIATFLGAIQKKITSVEFGAQWGPGMFAESAVVYRLLPIASFMRAKSLENIAKRWVKEDNFRDIFNKLDEGVLKVELRRQYYLLNHGEKLDDFPINFSVNELFDAGMLDKNIKKANKKAVLDLSSLKISNLYGLSKVLGKIEKNIESLKLDHNDLVVISNDSFSDYLYRLKKIDLSYNQIVALQEDCFVNLPNLDELYLGNNNLVFLSGDVFEKQSNLSNLDLSDNKIIFINSMAFYGLQKLQNLNLGDNQIEVLPPNVFQSLTGLKELYLKGNKIKRTDLVLDNLREINNVVSIVN